MALGLAGLVACSQESTPTVQQPLQPSPAAFGFVEVTVHLGNEKAGIAPSSTASMLDSLASQSLDYFGNGIQIDNSAVSVTTITYGERGEGGERFVNATFRVRNAQQDGTPYPDARENLTLLGVNGQAGTSIGTIGGTAIRNLWRFDDSPASSDIASQIMPTHGMRFGFGTLEPELAPGAEDFQAFTEPEIAAMTGNAPSADTESILPYGFVVRCVENCTAGSRSLMSNPDEEQFDGLVTFAFRIPLQDNATDDPFRFTMLFLAVDDSNTRVTESLEEQGDSQAEARADTLTAGTPSPAEVTVLGDSTTTVTGNNFIRICSLRTAGTADTPTAFLVNSTGGECGEPQTITFAQPASPQTFGATFNVNPTASSGLPISLVASGGCTVSPATTGHDVLMTSGTTACVLTASQAGSGIYAAADPVEHTVAAQKAAQTIEFTSSPPSPASVGGSYAVSATASSGLGVNFSSLTESVCQVSGSTVSLIATGTCTVAANQSGNDDYQAAPQVTQAFTVTGVAPSYNETLVVAHNNAATILSIPKPFGVTQGDFLLAQITFEKGSDAGTNAQITPSGWTLVLRTNRGTDLGQAIFYKFAGASEPASYTFPFSQSVKAAGGILSYSGVDPVNPIVMGNGNSGDSSTLTANSVTATANSRLVAFYGFKKQGVTLSVPSGMASRYTFQNPQDVLIMAADEVRSSAGATGSRVSTTSVSDKWVAQLVVLRGQ